jgi:hypothetical protein
MRCPHFHGTGFREDGSTCDLCHGAGEIEVRETPDDQEKKKKPEQ